MPPIDYTTLPACTQEDGSDPGQIFPCRWDASVQGNGIGKSFVMTDQDTVLYDATPVVQPEPEVSPANPEPAALTLPEQPAATEAQVLVSPAPAQLELAHTGPTDPIMWAAAALMVVVGAVLAPVGKRARRRSS